MNLVLSKLLYKKSFQDHMIIGNSVPHLLGKTSIWSQTDVMSLPSLSHDSVSKTLEDMELPRMGSQTGNSNEKLMTIVPTTHTAVSPAPVLAHIPSSETCGQRFFEILKKNGQI